MSKNFNYFWSALFCLTFRYKAQRDKITLKETLCLFLSSSSIRWRVVSSKFSMLPLCVSFRTHTTERNHARLLVLTLHTDVCLQKYINHGVQTDGTWRKKRGCFSASSCFGVENQDAWCEALAFHPFASAPQAGKLNYLSSSLFAELLDIALGIRWPLIAGTVVASVVRSFSVWLASVSPEEIYVLWMPNRWVPIPLSPRRLQVLIDVRLCQDGSGWRATKIINDLISFSVEPPLKKYPRPNVGNAFTGGSHKADVDDSYPRCQRLAQERSIERDGMQRLWKQCRSGAELGEPHAKPPWRGAAERSCSPAGAILDCTSSTPRAISRAPAFFFFFFAPVQLQLQEWRLHRDLTCKSRLENELFHHSLWC